MEYIIYKLKFQNKNSSCPHHCSCWCCSHWFRCYLTSKFLQLAKLVNSCHLLFHRALKQGRLCYHGIYHHYSYIMYIRRCVWSASSLGASLLFFVPLVNATMADLDGHMFSPSFMVYFVMIFMACCVRLLNTLLFCPGLG